MRPQQDQSTRALIALDRELEQRHATLQASAASLIDPDRLKGVVLAAFTRTPALWECDPVTIARAVVESAQYGLEPTGAIGGAHLVPFRNKRTGKKEAQLIIDYRGYVQMARRSGEVAKVVARVVRELDEFRVEQGSEERLVHIPYLGWDDPGRYTHVYAVLTFRDGTTQHDWDTWAWVQTIRKRSKAGNDGPWVTDEAEMAKKSILRRLMKLAPVTVEAARAIEYEERMEAVRAPEAPASRPALAAPVARVHERLGITTGRGTGPAPAGPGAGPAVIEGDDEPPHPATTSAGTGSKEGTVSVPAPDAAPSDRTPDGAGSEGPGAPAVAPGPDARCEAFHAELGACRRPAGHSANHQNGDKESWK